MWIAQLPFTIFNKVLLSFLLKVIILFSRNCFLLVKDKRNCTEYLDE
jgi:hypothetical protein